jgi:hypothetical protein
MMIVLDYVDDQLITRRYCEERSNPTIGSEDKTVMKEIQCESNGYIIFNSKLMSFESSSHLPNSNRTHFHIPMSQDNAPQQPWSRTLLSTYPKILLLTVVVVLVERFRLDEARSRLSKKAKVSKQYETGAPAMPARRSNNRKILEKKRY